MDSHGPFGNCALREMVCIERSILRTQHRVDMKGRNRVDTNLTVK